MKLDRTLKDRIILSNQFRILEKLYPDEAEHFEQHRKALENGYELNNHRLKAVGLFGD